MNPAMLLRFPNLRSCPNRSNPVTHGDFTSVFNGAITVYVKSLGSLSKGQGQSLPASVVYINKSYERP